MVLMASAPAPPPPPPPPKDAAATAKLRRLVARAMDPATPAAAPSHHAAHEAHTVKRLWAVAKALDEAALRALDGSGDSGEATEVP